jgi:hypothetical protein
VEVEEGSGVSKEIVAWVATRSEQFRAVRFRLRKVESLQSDFLIEKLFHTSAIKHNFTESD